MPTPAAAAMPAVPATITVAPPTRIVTLSDALSAALSDPDVATRWRVSHDQAAQDVALARAAREPQFSSTLRVRTRNTSNLVDVAPDQTGFVGEKSRVSLTAAMPLYDGGRTTDAIHAADAGLRATDQSVRAARIHVISATESAYYSLLRAQKIVDLDASIVGAAQQHLEGAQSRFDVGSVTKGDVYSAQSAVASAVADQERHKAELVSARVRLARLMGQDATGFVPAAVDPPASAEVTDDSASLLNKALAYNPELARLQAEQTRARAELSGVRAQRSPRVSVQVSAGYANRQSFSSVGDVSGYYDLLLFDITMPLFQRQSQRAQERNREDQVELARLSLDDARDDLRAEVLVRLTDYQDSAASVAAAQSAVQSAAEAQRLASERYAVGKGAQIEVLDAMTRLAEVQNRLVDAQIRHADATTRLHDITGTGLLP